MFSNMKKLLTLLTMAAATIGSPVLTFAADSDLSDNANVIYIKSMTAAPGTQVNLSIQMKNTAEIRGFEADLYLPEGVTVAQYSNGNYRTALNPERLPEGDIHTLGVEKQSDGAYRLLCGSLSYDTFTGTEGEIGTITVNIAENMAEDTYPIILKNMKLSENDIANFYTTEYVETTLTIAIPQATILDENSTTVPAASDGEVDVIVKRTLTANQWSTICLPFAMTEAQLKEAFGDDVKLALFNDYDEEYDESGENILGITVNFSSSDVADGIDSNYPYLIKVSNDISEFSVNATINPNEEEAIAMYYTGKIGKPSFHLYGSFQGIFHAGDPVPAKCLFLAGNKFWYSTGKTTLKAFRGYFNFEDVLSSVNTEDVSGVKFNFVLDNNPTAIDFIDGEIENGAMYDLSGRKITQPKQRGIYIVNGKKVAVK